MSPNKSLIAAALTLALAACSQSQQETAAQKAEAARDATVEAAQDVKQAAQDTAAAAQDASPPSDSGETATLDRIEVTGSRIRGAKSLRRSAASTVARCSSAISGKL